jgi:hypothetical protein
MSEPNVCEQCQERHAIAKGLCNRCYHAKRYREHPEIYRQNEKSWNERHRDERAAYLRVWQAEHRSELEAYRRVYYSENREQRRANARAYRAKHQEEINTRNRLRQRERREQRAAVDGNAPQPAPKRLCEQCQERLVKATSLCSRCYDAKRRQEQPERVKAQKRAEYQRHREQRIAHARALRTADPAESGRALCDQCKERLAAAKGLCSRCYAANRRKEEPERVRAQTRAWYERRQRGESGSKVCEQCEERPALSKGLCNRCYKAKRYKENPERERARQRASYARQREEQRAYARGASA